MTPQEWLLLLPQLPPTPSSLRVQVWRRLRAVGALGIHNGVWVLPRSEDHERFLDHLLAEVRAQGGNGLLFVASPLDAAVPADIVARFQAERAEDYVEFAGRCRDFLAEIAKETGSKNFTFAELEENEQDLHKLAGWLKKIQTRDFFRGEQAEQAERALAGCQQALDVFTQAVYTAAGLAPIEEQRDEKDEEH